MAKRIAQFHKVSFEQFAEGFQDTFLYTDPDCARTRENSKDSDWNPRGDAGKLGVKMLPEKRTWI